MKTEIFQTLLRDPLITDLCFNGHSAGFIDRGKGLEAIETSLFPDEIVYRNFILEQISLSGKTWDAKLPFVDTVFFKSHRAHVAFPPLATSGIYLSLRKLPAPPSASLSEMQALARTRWTHSARPFEMLLQSIKNHESILVAGGTGSGKTTLLNDLLLFCDSRERIIALEDTPEVSPCHPHYLGMVSRQSNADGFGSVSLRDLLKQTLRMRPDRIIIGECRGDEVLDLLQALNTGHRGSLATLHANSAKEALRRIELLALLAAKGTIPGSLIKELLAHGVQKVVFMNRGQRGREIETILCMEGIEREILFTRPLYSKESLTAAVAPTI